MEITVAKECRSSPEKVFSLMKDALGLPAYWHGMREISDNGNGTYSVKFQFPGKAVMEYSCNQEDLTCVETYKKGPFTGTKTTRLSDTGGMTELRSEWKIKLSVMLRPMQNKMQKHLSEGTENALQRLCEAAYSGPETKQ